MPKPFKLKPGEPLTDAQRLMPVVRAADELLGFINTLDDFKDDKGNRVFEEWPKPMDLDDVMKTVEY